MREGLRDYTRDLLLSQRARERGMFRENEVRRMLDENAAGRSEYSMHLWTLLVFEHWMRQYADRTDWTPAADIDALPQISPEEGRS